MNIRSRDEKLNFAKKRLKKFQENTNQSNKKDITYVLSESQVSQLNKKGIVEEKNSTNIPNPIPNNDFKAKFSNEILTNIPNPIPNNDFKAKFSNEISTNIPNPIPNNDFKAKFCNEPSATSEGIEQISKHLNSLISRSGSSLDRESQLEYSNIIRDLEKRNIELASLNSNKLEQIQILNGKVEQLNEQIAQYNDEYNYEKNNMQHIHQQHIDNLKSQLQSQVHTISLLVAEKSELQSQISHSQKINDQRYKEIEDMKIKLKNTNRQVSDLEKIIDEYKYNNNRQDGELSSISCELDTLNNSINKLNLEKQEIISESQQFKSKLLSKTQDYSSLEIDYNDLKNQLEMTKVQVQHLSNIQKGDFEDITKRLAVEEEKYKNLYSESSLAKKTILELEDQNGKLQSQYRSYFEQMEKNLSTMQLKLSKTESEYREILNELEMTKTELNQSKSIIEKENYEKDDLKKLENELLLKNNQLEELEYNFKKSNQIIEKLKFDNEQISNLNNKLEEDVSKNQEALHEFKLKNDDYFVLLEQFQSDKTALSRALSQNKQLKSQIYELQEAFVKLSSENMDLTTNLEHEKYVNKELVVRLDQQEDELRSMIDKNDNSIMNLVHDNNDFDESEKMVDTNKNMNQINEELIKNLESELNQCRNRINFLTNENNHLKYSSKDSKTEENKSFVNIHQLEAERNELLLKCQHLKEMMNNNRNDSTEKEKISELEQTTQDLSQKIEFLLDDKKKLEEYNTQLEHIIEQLESETDTIAEYIHLYQNQRAVLKQRNLVKDQMISKIVHEKNFLDKKMESFQKNIDILIRFKKSIDFTKNQEFCNIFNEIVSILFDIQNILSFGDYETCSSNKCSSSNSVGYLNDSSEDFINYRIIHCKCCTGKIIDL